MPVHIKTYQMSEVKISNFLKTGIQYKKCANSMKVISMKIGIDKPSSNTGFVYCIHFAQIPFRKHEAIPSSSNGANRVDWPLKHCLAVSLGER